jgi:N-acetylmuramoyl-L-alanine amidase
MHQIARSLFFLFLPAILLCKENPIIVLDAGHGGKDQGARVKNFEEKKLALRTTYLVKKHLEGLGYRVVMTRVRDVFLPLGTRVSLANRRGPSLFVSIHYNSALNPAAKGIEVYYCGKEPVKQRGESKKFAAFILDQMIAMTNASSRGVKQANFQVIRETLMPAVLIEAGFITNSEERQNLGTQAYLDKLAFGVARGIDKYVKS